MSMAMKFMENAPPQVSEIMGLVMANAQNPPKEVKNFMEKVWDITTPERRHRR